MFARRKPTNKGRESHTDVGCDTGCFMFVEPYEGKTRMNDKEFVREYGKNPSKCIRCVNPWFGSGRVVIEDSGFALVPCAKGLAEHGLFMIGNVNGASTGFPKAWLRSQLKERGDRACASSNIKLGNGDEWSLLVAADIDNPPMCLLGTTGTTNMGEDHVKPYNVLKADGSTEVRKAVLTQWSIHNTYKKNFNAIYIHNSKRHGGNCFEDTLKTHKWWLREFQVMMRMPQVNAYLLWKKIKPGEGSCNPDLLRRRLCWKMMYNPTLMREIGEAVSLRARALPPTCYLVKCPIMGKHGRPERRRCKYCFNNTMWSCACAPCTSGMDEEARKGVMWICSASENPDCFANYNAG